MKAVVRDVMSSLPIAVLETTPFREIAGRLRECRVSAFPVLDADGKVRGVVSEADLLVKEAVRGEPGGVGGFLAGIAHHAARAKARGITAADLMTSPALTIGPDDTVDHAARLGARNPRNVRLFLPSLRWQAGTVALSHRDGPDRRDVTLRRSGRAGPGAPGTAGSRGPGRKRAFPRS